MAFNFNAVADLLRCPKSRAELVLDGDWLVSSDPETRLRYPIRDDIPCLLVDDAETLPPDEWQAVMRRHGRDADGKLPAGGR